MSPFPVSPTPTSSSKYVNRGYFLSSKINVNIDDTRQNHSFKIYCYFLWFIHRHFPAFQQAFMVSDLAFYDVCIYFPVKWGQQGG